MLFMYVLFCLSSPFLFFARWSCDLSHGSTCHFRWCYRCL